MIKYKKIASMTMEQLIFGVVTRKALFLSFFSSGLSNFLFNKYTMLIVKVITYKSQSVRLKYCSV